MTTFITAVISCIAVLFAIAGALIGLWHRTFRSLIRIVTVIIAALLAVVIARPVASAAASALNGSLETLINEISPEAAALLEKSQLLQNILDAAVSCAVAIPAYMALFAVLMPLMLIPYAIICRLLFNKGKKQSAGEAPVRRTDFRGDRAVGAAIGAIAGLLVYALWLAPVFGICRLAGDTLKAFDDEDVGEISDAVCAVSGSWFARASAVPSEIITNQLTRTKIDGKTVILSEELEELTEILPSLLAVIPGEGEEISLEELPELFDTIAESENAAELIPVVMNIGITALDVDVSVPEDAADAYSSALDFLAEKLNTVSGEEEFVNYGASVIAGSGLAVDGQIAEMMCRGLYICMSPEAPDITPERIETFLGSVLGESYLESIKGFKS